MYVECSTYQNLDRSTVADIQKKIVDRGGRRAVSRVMNAKSDKDAIAAWRQDLNRILHIFNVRSVDSSWHSPMASLQTELAISTHMLVADMHRNALKDQDDTAGRRQSVSAAFYPPATKH